MSFTVPSLRKITNGSTGYDIQAVFDTTDEAALAMCEIGFGVATGCAVSAETTPAMEVKVAAGVVYVAGLAVAVTAVATLTITAATTHDRRDIVTVNKTGTASVTKGTPGTVATQTRSTATYLPPIKPTIPATHTLLAEVTVTHGTTAVHSYNLVDKRCMLYTPPIGSWVHTYWYPGTCRATTMAMTKGRIYFRRLVVTAPMTTKATGLYVGTTEATVKLRFGLYATTGHGKPGKRLKTLGTAASASGKVTKTTSTYVLWPGIYWIAAVRQGTSASVTFKVREARTGFSQPGIAVTGAKTITSTSIPFAWRSTASTYTSGALPATAPALVLVSAIATSPYIAVQAK